MTVIKTISVGLLAVAVALFVALVHGNRGFRRSSEREVERRFARAGGRPDQLVTEDMLTDLPEPVQRYLRRSGVVGNTIPRTVRLKQTGRFRTGRDQPWMTFTADEFYTADEPSFLWDATFKMKGLPILRVRDSYDGGHGRMLGALGGLVPVVDGHGDGIDQGSMMRYLQEVVWFPAAFLSERIAFAPIDDATAEVTFTDGGRSVSGVLHIDDDGKITNFVAERFHNDQVGYATWTTPMTDFGEFEGLLLPVRGKGVWGLPDGEFEYIDVTVTQLEYDVPDPF
jgi:hypothetical protein